MANALVGHTGLVGSNLNHQATFHDLYHSKNIEQIHGKEYELLVCAGAPAEKWRANQEPTADFQNLERLVDCLAKVRVGKFILISTIDVYSQPFGVDEDSPIKTEKLLPYGKHRLLLENFARSSFNSVVIRLPGLFGTGLKKNIIYDLLNSNQCDQLHADSVYQFYYLNNLWRDIMTILSSNVAVMNFATEPVSVKEVALEVFGILFDNKPDVSPARYDVRTKYDYLYGKSGGVLYDRHEILKSIKRFVSTERYTR